MTTDKTNMLHNISPIDGRYAEKTAVLAPYFSEAALMRYRCHVEVEYLIALIETGVIQGGSLSAGEKEGLRKKRRSRRKWIPGSRVKTIGYRSATAIISNGETPISTQMANKAKKKQEGRW